MGGKDLLGSRNGTHTHGRAITDAWLRPGGAVTLGLHAVRLVWG
jgi:hypothetical protein